MASRKARQAAAEQQLAVIRIGDAEYQLDELTLNELADLEDEMGCGLDALDFGSARALRYIAYLYARRTDPTATPESVGASITMRSFLADPDGANPPD